MFYYDHNKDQILEVNIGETYSASDLERLLLFIDALSEKSYLKVSFTIHPSVKNEFLTCLDSSVATPTYQFNIN
ncbi:hypothetical protein [Autumnicola edwardsiae]|jgi:hypothetical protein|uniref:Uncharacterized protein n=1 Tax=Autumnicola edwardsiae TaxID=3075594 RepID=A0ABU3CYD9_9FLAO|nr:hypothetical protein [Zunongwangia sp. F297]MDT0651393.1 hypothetical protein [Zunongwangia sp. F297]